MDLGHRAQSDNAFIADDALEALAVSRLRGRLRRLRGFGIFVLSLLLIVLEICLKLAFSAATFAGFLWLIKEHSRTHAIIVFVYVVTATAIVSMLIGIVFRRNCQIALKWFYACEFLTHLIWIPLSIADNVIISKIFVVVRQWALSFNHAQTILLHALILITLMALIWLMFPTHHLLPPLGLCVTKRSKIGFIVSRNLPLPYLILNSFPKDSSAIVRRLDRLSPYDFIMWSAWLRYVWLLGWLRRNWLQRTSQLERHCSGCLGNLSFERRVRLACVAWEDGSFTLETAWSAMFLQTSSISRKRVHDIILKHLPDTNPVTMIDMIPEADPIFVQTKQFVAELISVRGWATIGPLLRGQVLPDDLKDLFLSARGGLRSLTYAGEKFRSDLNFMEQMIEMDPNAIIFTGKQLRKNAAVFAALMKKANLLSDHVLEGGIVKAKVMVMSVRYSLAENATTIANDVLLLIRELQQADEPSMYDDFAVYTPNEFSKGFCGGGSCWWKHKRYITDSRCRCRGQRDGPLRCYKFADHIDLTTTPPGMPNSDEVCWRYSFRWHLERALLTGGCMLQVEEFGMLGYGQKIEMEMAMELGIPIITLAVKSDSKLRDLVTSNSKLRDLVTPATAPAAAAAAVCRRDNYVSMWLDWAFPYLGAGYNG